MKNGPGFRARRNAMDRSWAKFMEGQQVIGVRDEVLSSWRRSRALLSPGVAAAPVGQTQLDHEALLTSARALDHTTRLALEDSNALVAVTDIRGQIVWTTGEPALSRLADEINHAPGGLWDEASMGVTAVSLALSCDRPAMVWSAEHWLPVLHDLACYAAPIQHPQTRRRLGVLNISTPWDKAHPALYMAVTALADRLGAEVATNRAVGDDECDAVELSVLGTHGLILGGRPVRLTRRQSEIVLLLALRRAGVGLAELHADLYGDEDVEMGTLKAEVSHLRRILGGRISRTPYRLLGNVRVDALELLEDLRSGRLADAVGRFHGLLLPWSESPRILRLARTVEVAIRDAVLDSNDYESGLALAGHMEDDAQLADHILQILPSGDGRRHILRGHLTSID